MLFKKISTYVASLLLTTLVASVSYADPVRQLKATITVMEHVLKDIGLKKQDHSKLVREFGRLTSRSSAQCSIIPHRLNNIERILRQAELEGKRKLATSISLLVLYQELYLLRLGPDGIKPLSPYQLQRGLEIEEEIRATRQEDSMIVVGKPGAVGALLDQVRNLMRP